MLSNLESEAKNDSNFNLDPGEEIVGKRDSFFGETVITTQRKITDPDEVQAVIEAGNSADAGSMEAIMQLIKNGKVLVVNSTGGDGSEPDMFFQDTKYIPKSGTAQK